MTYPSLRPGARPVAAACFRAVRQRLAYVRGHERTLAALHGFLRAVAARNPLATPSHAPATARAV